ncbi:MAG: cell division protein ZapA [bacterium]
MPQPKESAQVHIFGHDFRIKVTPEEKSCLKEATRLVTEKITAISKAGGSSDLHRLALMAALELAFDLIELKSKPSKRARLTAEAAIAEKETEDSQRLDQILARLDAVLASE